jgi:hypothetical protein
MNRLWLVAVLVLPFQDPSPADAARSAIKVTAENSYAYAVKGRFSREGVFAPPGILTARIDGFQSARNGPVILVKGPEGLWKTPDERIGEQVEGTPADVADKVTSLREAEPPHEMLKALLDETKSGAELDTPGSYLFVYRPERVRASVEKQLDRAVERKTMVKPTEVDWGSIEGRLWVRLARAGGPLAHFREERSVRIVYRRAGEPEETKRYSTKMEFDLSAHGTATVELPPEVRTRLGLK